MIPEEKRRASGSEAPSRHRHRWLRRVGMTGIALFVLTVVGALVIYSATRPPHDRLFRGKLESQWIKELTIGEDEEQLAQWREFGDDGLEILARGLERADHPGERLYRNVHKKTSWFLMETLRVPIKWLRFFPEPKMDETVDQRLVILRLLDRMNEAAYPAMPSIIHSLSDENPQVRNAAIGCLFTTDHVNIPLEQVSKKQKRKIFEHLVREATTRSKHTGLRHTSSFLLRYYPEEKETVSALLLDVIQDTSKNTRCVAVESLFVIAPEHADTAEMADMSIELLNDPDDQVASRIPKLLARMSVEQERIVGELITHVKNKSSLVATEAAKALGNFPGYADEILPALWEAHNDPAHHARTWGTEPSLKKLDPEGAAAAGIR